MKFLSLPLIEEELLQEDPQTAEPARLASGLRFCPQKASLSQFHEASETGDPARLGSGLAGV